MEIRKVCIHALMCCMFACATYVTYGTYVAIMCSMCDVCDMWNISYCRREKLGEREREKERERES